MLYSAGGPLQLRYQRHVPAALPTECYALAKAQGATHFLLHRQRGGHRDVRAEHGTVLLATCYGGSNAVQWFCSAPRWGHLGIVVLFSATLGAFRDNGYVMRHAGGHFGTVVLFSATLGHLGKVVVLCATLAGISVQWYCSPPLWGNLGTVVLFSATLGAFRDSGYVMRHAGGHFGTVVLFSATLGHLGVVVLCATLAGISVQWYCSPPLWGHLRTVVLLCPPLGHIGTMVMLCATLGVFRDSGCFLILSTGK